MCGEQERWEAARLGQLVSRYGELINVRHLVSTPSPGALVDEGHVLAALGGENGAQYLVRPDGYVAFRCSGYDLDGLDAYLRRWFLPRTPQQLSIEALARPLGAPSVDPQLLGLVEVPFSLFELVNGPELEVAEKGPTHDLVEHLGFAGSDAGAFVGLSKRSDSAPALSFDPTLSAFSD